MKITLKCKCGATIELEDARGVYIKNDGTVDEKGRKFLMEVRSDEWQERHQACLEKCGGGPV